MFSNQHYGEIYSNLVNIASEFSKHEGQSLDHTQDSLHNMGQLAPDFQLSTADGQALTLSNLRGSRVIVAFVAPWGRLCQSQLPALARLARESGMAVLAICSGEERCAIEDFVSEYDITFPVLHDPNSEVKRQYEVTCLPMTFYVDEQGRIAGFHRGEVDEAILSHWQASVSSVGSLQ